ncbi:hypothetical protein SAMN06269185_3310 [Natronoarchaeum philippinense]|uniref:DUF7344 domain-containing protein n=1 Tax=Natronoarchaeum philippinense TaxID=558529 RepID=A0A285P945_NATPI|nr:hypothetical protein [Natronoarchaeum philippinense]SNZ18255.1 hypothetical protein SAMN06269185_3310 [Natronoarchaeum philippinense]
MLGRIIDALTGTRTEDANPPEQNHDMSVDMAVTPNTSLSLSELGEIITNACRRDIVEIVNDHCTETGQAVGLGDLARVVAARENDKQPSEITSDERKRVYVALYQVHLPKLESMGAIACNDSHDAIVPTPETAGICEALVQLRELQTDPDDAPAIPPTALTTERRLDDLDHYDSAVGPVAVGDGGDEA